MEPQQYDFAIIGVGVMGSNLLLNMADHGFAVVGYDLNPVKTLALEKEATPGTIVKGVNTVAEMVSLLKVPRKMMMLVPAGKPVDDVIAGLLEYVEPGDIILDGGNSHFTDTLRRVKLLEEKGLHFMGVGISGGEEGARIGPSIMPGGDKGAYEYLRPLFEAVAAKVNGVPCVDYLGKGGAGHYVKMVHNGIEYSIMQLICESYDVLKSIGGLNNDELHEVFTQWNNGDLQSFLIEITALIFKTKDADTGNYLVDMVLDQAGSKGTGKWTTQEASDLPIPIPTIDAAVAARNMSVYKEQRTKAYELYKPEIPALDSEHENLESDLENALAFAFVIAYAQGLSMLAKASGTLQMDIPLPSVIQVWKAGCIIRSALLVNFTDSFAKDGTLPNLLLNSDIADLLKAREQSVRNVVAQGVQSKIPLPGIMSALAYYDTYNSKTMPTNLIQAQRDLFGAHTYQRIDKQGVFHSDWG